MEPGATNEPMRKRQADQRRRFHTVVFISIETEYQQRGDTRSRRAALPGVSASISSSRSR